MKKILALYKMPVDAEAFLEHYQGQHMPLVSKIPGLLKTEITRVDRTFMGETGNFLLAEMYFEDDTFKAAMGSAENAAVGNDLKNFAEGISTIMVGTVLDL